MIKNNQIYIVHGTDYKQMAVSLAEECCLDELIPSKDIRVGIKPNLVSASEASFGATTHPEVVAGVIEYLQNRGFRNIVMLEGSWVGERTADSVKVCGYDELSGKYGVPFIDTQKEKGILTDCNGMKIPICKAALDVEFLINVPVLKGHCQTKITCALKNMQGLIPNKEKRQFHAMGLHKPIAHLNAGIRQHFILVDNICGDPDFEDGGNPLVMNRLLGAVDPVLVDAYVCRLMHYETPDVPYIGMAEALGVGSADLSAADIRTLDGQGDDDMPYSRKVVEVCDHVQEVDSCSACYGYLIPALSRLKEEGLLDGFDTTICIGQGFRGKQGELGIGHCTHGFRRHLEGCPPLETDIYEFLKSYIEEVRP